MKLCTPNNVHHIFILNDLHSFLYMYYFSFVYFKITIPHTACSTQSYHRLEKHASEKGMIYFLLFSLFPSVAMGSRCRKMAVHHKTSPRPHAPLVRQRTPYTEDSSLSPSFHPALHLTGGGYG